MDKSLTLSVRDLSAGYGDHVAVDGVSLDVAAGEVAAIVGPNGCGKSTLLHSIARLHRPAAGQVLLGDDDIWALRPRDAARRISLLAQSPEAPEAITVAGLARFGRHPHQGLFQQWSADDEQAVAQALAAAGVSDLAHRRLDHLSGGQRQRCWMALVLAQQAPVLLLDEPTSMLDLGHVIDILGLVRGLAARGRIVVMVLHDLSMAARYADRLIGMRDGRVVAAGAPCSVVTPQFVQRLYDVKSDILTAPGDGAPVVVTADRTARR